MLVGIKNRYKCTVNFGNDNFSVLVFSVMYS